MKAEYIEWVDSSGGGKWVNKRELAEYAQGAKIVCRSVGFICYEDDEVLTLCSSFDRESVLSPVTIFKCAVKKRKKIKLPKCSR